MDEVRRPTLTLSKPYLAAKLALRNRAVGEALRDARRAVIRRYARDLDSKRLTGKAI